MENEILDLVNKDDDVIGQIPRSQSKGITNVRVINAFVVNDEGKLWIPRRHPNKKSYPNALDMSVGGYVSAGETYQETFRRETMEELNLDIDTVAWRDLGLITPHEHGTAAFMHVYEIQSNTAPRFNPEDFTEGSWLTPQEILAKIAAGDLAKGDLSILLRFFYAS